MQLDQDKLKSDNQNLINALREKNRKHAQTQELYDRLKRKEMTAATRNAAYDSADDVLQSAVRGRGETIQQGRKPQGPSPLGRYSGRGDSRSPAKVYHGNIGMGGNDREMMPPPPAPRHLQSLVHSGLSLRKFPKLLCLLEHRPLTMNSRSNPLNLCTTSYEARRRPRPQCYAE